MKFPGNLYVVFLLTILPWVGATSPTTQCTDSCNPVTRPSLGEAVPVGIPYTITWTPTTTRTISIQLLRGPSTDIVPLFMIVEGVKNTGTFTWTPSTDLEADVSHYGLQIINDADGTFQYSVQFGISNSGKGLTTAVGTTTTQKATPTTAVPTTDLAKPTQAVTTAQTTVKTTDTLITKPIPTSAGETSMISNGLTPTESNNATPGLSSTSTSGPQTAPTGIVNTGPSTSPNSYTKSSLPKAAKFGIGIGAAVAGIAIVAMLAVILLLLRRRGDVTANPNSPDTSSDLPEMVTSPWSGRLEGGNVVRSELGAGEAQLVERRVGPQELGTGRDEDVVAELDTRRRS